MAEESEHDGQEKTESPTDERREQFRQRGDVVHSRELTSVIVLMAVSGWLYYTAGTNTEYLVYLLRKSFESLVYYRPSVSDLTGYFADIWLATIRVVLPIAAVSMTAAIFFTMIQTRLNISWKRIEPQWGRLNPLSGLKRLISVQAIAELLKSLGKMCAVSGVLFFILYSEWEKVPALMNLSLFSVWNFWSKVTFMLFSSVSVLLMVIASFDYLYNFISLENKMKMTRQEVKEEFKQREIDPQVRMRMRKLQRDLGQRRTIDKTKKATVLITNPTHYSIALFYEHGMSAPVLIAKGKDFLALKMRETAKDHGIPLVEDRPVARALYKSTEEGEEIPQNLYRAVSEIIRYVFKIKGIKINRTR